MMNCACSGGLSAWPKPASVVKVVMRNTSGVISAHALSRRHLMAGHLPAARTSVK
jgi:hypothetical protein